jgi:hypothetical protein
MPDIFLDLQLFGEEGASMAGADSGSSGIATATAENPAAEGVATGSTGEQIAPATADQSGAPVEETWDSLIKGKYKSDYDKAIKKAINNRFKNDRNLQGQIDSIDPIIRTMAERYGVRPNPDGSIPIAQLQAAIDNDNSIYEKEAFEKGIPVEQLKRTKQLEREVAQLRNQNAQSERDRQWNEVVQQAEAAKQVYPNFDLDSEMQNPNFGRLLATMQRSGFPNAVKTVYEIIHKDEIMGGAMAYAVQQTQNKISNSIQSGMTRPAENGIGQQSTASVGNVDPSKLTKAQIDDIRKRAERGEKITF